MLNNESLYIDIHVLQSVPPCNINRDDTGSPKTARFGGVTRNRVSSQAWKKAARDLFPSLLNEEQIGFRTKHAIDLIAKKIVQAMPGIEQAEAIKMAQDTLGATGIKIANSETGYLLFISPLQVKGLAQLAVTSRANEQKVDKKVAKEILDIHRRPTLNAVDIAMFGRMVAEAPDLNVDASVQVAHAIGVGKATQEFDYFTALDDCAPSDNAGAAHLDTTEFSSATLYRYANIDVRHLCENLDSAAAALEGIGCFIKAFITSMPTGKQNSFANRTLPSAVVVQLRESQPVSLVNAFERAVVPRDGESQTELACKALVKQEQTLDKAFGVLPQHTYTVCGSSEASAIEELSNGDSTSLDALIVSVKKECQVYLASCGYAVEVEE